MSVRIVYNGFIKLVKLNECDKKKYDTFQSCQRSKYRTTNYQHLTKIKFIKA